MSVLLVLVEMEVNVSMESMDIYVNVLLATLELTVKVVSLKQI